MARYTKDRIQAKIDLWEDADDAVSQGQSFTINGKQYTAVDAPYIAKRLDSLYAELANVESGRSGGIVAMQGRVAR